MKNDKAYRALLAQEHAIQEAADRKSVSLLESKRRAEHEKSRREQRARENEIRVAHGLAPLPAEPEPESGDEDLLAGEDGSGRDKDNPEDFDVVLEEATKVLGDYLDLSRKQQPASRLAAGRLEQPAAAPADEAAQLR